MSDAPLWYKDAVFYELHVKAFQDSNGDGIGDFNGLIQRLGHVQNRAQQLMTRGWLLRVTESVVADDRRLLWLRTACRRPLLFAN